MCSEQNAQAGPAASEALKDYVELDLTVNWFPTHRKVAADSAAEMAAVVGAEAKSLSLGRKLFDSKEPELQAVNAARRDVEKLVERFCIPKIALTRADIGGGAKATYEHGRAAGRRLIRRDMLAEFVAMLAAAEARLRESLLDLQAALPAILGRQQQKQGKVFRMADYPEDLGRCVSINYRVCSTTVDLSLAQACPELYRRELALLEAERAATVQAFAEDFSSKMAEYVNHFAGQLGWRKRVRPSQDGPYARFYDAELIRLADHFDRDDLAPGEVVAVLQPKDGKEADREEVGPLPAELFASTFSPYDTRDRKTLRDAAVAKLTEQLDVWFVQADAFGPYRGVIAGQVERVKAELAKASATLDPQDIARELRHDGRAARAIGAAVSALGRSLQEGVRTVKAGRRAVSFDLSDFAPAPAPEPAEG